MCVFTLLHRYQHWIYVTLSFSLLTNSAFVLTRGSMRHTMKVLVQVIFFGKIFIYILMSSFIGKEWDYEKDICKSKIGYKWGWRVDILWSDHIQSLTIWWHYMLMGISRSNELSDECKCQFIQYTELSFFDDDFYEPCACKSRDFLSHHLTHISHS